MWTSLHLRESAALAREIVGGNGILLETDVARFFADAEAISAAVQKAQAEAQRLMEKDHTYSTQAEVAADEARLHELDQKIGEMRMSSQDRIDEMQMRLLQEITLEIQDFLTEYNAGHKFDFIFSIQNEGQIWVGNKGLDITADVVAGLNARHRAKKVAGSTPENK